MVSEQFTKFVGAQVAHGKCVARFTAADGSELVLRKKTPETLAESIYCAGERGTIYGITVDEAVIQIGIKSNQDLTHYLS